MICSGIIGKIKVFLVNIAGIVINPATADIQTDGTQKTKLVDSGVNVINPSTEEKQDSIIENQTDGTQRTRLVDEGGSLIQTSNPLQVQIGDGTNSPDIVEHEGEKSIRMVAGGEEIYRVHFDVDNTTGVSGFMILDLSDTVKFPHVETGHIDLLDLVININPTTSPAFIGDIHLGFLSSVDNVDGDLNIIKTWHLQKGGININQCCDWAFTHYTLNLASWFGPTNANDTTWQTDVNLLGPDGTITFPSGDGDLVLFLNSSSGNVDIGCTVAYKTLV